MYIGVRQSLVARTRLLRLAAPLGSVPCHVCMCVYLYIYKCCVDIIVHVC